MKFSKILLIGCAIILSGPVLAEPRDLPVPKPLATQLKSFEPSGSTYIQELKQYLVVSDDTDKKKSPMLFLVGKDGQLGPEAVVISGVQKMTDMESVSQDEKGFFYLLSSMGLSKKGKDASERNLLVRATRLGKTFKAKDVLELRGLLVKALEASEVPVLKGMRSRVKAELDVESHYVEKGSLYIGLKNPQPRPGTALILDLGPVERLLAQKSLPSSRVTVSREIDFKAVSGEGGDLLSEILHTADGLWLATTTEAGGSRFWRMDPKSNKLILKKHYPKKRLEGLAFDTDAKKLLLLFDHGENQAQLDFEGI